MSTNVNTGASKVNSDGPTPMSISSPPADASNSPILITNKNTATTKITKPPKVLPLHKSESVIHCDQIKKVNEISTKNWTIQTPDTITIKSVS